MEIKDGVLVKIDENDIIDGILDIPYGVKSISTAVGFQMNSLEEINMPDSVITIFDGAFSHCSSLRYIIFSSNLKEIGASAFSYCKNLKSFVLPESLEIIGSKAFGCCPNLVGLVIPKNVTKFEFLPNQDSYFYENLPYIELLTSLKMPFDNIKKISAIGKTFSVYDTNLREDSSIDNDDFDEKLMFVIRKEFSIKIINELINQGIDYSIYMDLIDDIIRGMDIKVNLQEQFENIINCIYAKNNIQENKSDKAIEDYSRLFITDEEMKVFYGYLNEPFKEKVDRQEEILKLYGADTIEEVPKKNNIKRIDSKILNNNGRILNYKEYKTSPAIGRDKEVEALMINLLQDKKSPILVGESGTGKTSIVEEFVYRIQENDVPSFLNGQLIYELSVNSALANTKYRGELEEKIKDILEECIDNNIILFIDEIHTIFGAGKTESSNADIASIIKFYIDRYDLKIIGTTTKDEYNKYLANDALKRRFEKINVMEPDYICMHQIIEKVINDFASKNNMSLDQINNNLSNLIDYLIELTQDKHRVYDDKINNPDLVISIIDKAFAYAKFEDNSVINIKHFIKAINSCDRIYDVRKEKVISLLENFSNKKQKTYSKCIKFEPLKQ